jgi:hypothetical protein
MELCRLGADAAGVVHPVSEPARVHILVERFMTVAAMMGDDERRGDKRRTGGTPSIDSSWLQYNP